MQRSLEVMQTLSSLRLCILALAGCTTVEPVAVTSPPVPTIIQGPVTRSEGVVVQPDRREFVVSTDSASVVVRRAAVTWLHVPPERVVTADMPPAAGDAPVALAPTTQAPVPVSVASAIVLFPFASAKPLAWQAVTDFVGALPAPGSKSLVAIGHADDVGSDDYNDRLAALRARTVAKFLSEQHGLTVEVASKGRREPVSDNHTERGRAENRRVEIYVKEPVRAGS